jgi:predicted dehydrogenase
MGKNKVQRRDFLKGLAAVPFLGYFIYGFRRNIAEKTSVKVNNYLELMQIEKLEAPEKKLRPATGINNKTLRIGLVGNGWRGEALLLHLGYAHPDEIKKNTLSSGNFNNYFRRTYVDNEDLNVEIAGICDVFDVHAQRGVEISQNYFRTRNGVKEIKPAKIYRNYRDMIAGGDIDAIIIATPDHTHAPIAIAAAKAGVHVYLEKPMTHSIEEAVELRNTIKSTGIVFQLGHENRQQMSYKIAGELYKKGVLGDVSMVQTFTNRNTIYGAWIRDDAFDHNLGNKDNINWKEFLAGAPYQEFDLKRFFSWQRYSEYGTGMTGNDFSHIFDSINQVLNLGIPETVIATGNQFYFKHHGDMPDVFNAVFNYPERKLTLSYNGTLKNDMYQQTRILGYEATMDIDRSIFLTRSHNTERYKNIKTDPSSPLYYYNPDSEVDAVSSATSKVYLKGGYGPTLIDGKMINTTFLHIKEWVDAIRGYGETSCNIDAGFEEAVTFSLANLAHIHKRPVNWDQINVKAIIK